MADDLTPPVPAGVDDYEVDDYTRVLVRLRSGRQAWVYALAGTGDGDQARR